ncbi:MAG: hypothetical protein WB763_13645 [Terriglobia bacterium]
MPYVVAAMEWRAMMEAGETPSLRYSCRTKTCANPLFGDCSAMAFCAATPSTFLFRERATTRTGEHRRRGSGPSQLGQSYRDREQA